MPDLKCSVCGMPAGNYKQHFNQDKGYGICGKCADTVQAEDSVYSKWPHEFYKAFGYPGVNFQLVESE